ncbi:two component transcriptional regulator, LuxR family [Octadecabacter temperatus]|uniref:Transcriptional regulatory protein TdiR n=1 Tax=Octadecabacter temperatus TaxID=1458307 RepID=A0A0K0Y7R3_9RHOB|nr:response regulator [Octadecabacter temperatus]AKS46955.1 Transcriptional regulatory protein TdiR [Octadecabacter temperatus]SIO24233.1 two component transcriptional regulator, LuxR family [Octadecabacter temperatus]
MIDTASNVSTVFLIDDDVKVRTSLSRALITRGFKVMTFEAAFDFLDVYDPSQPGCLVLDYGLPQMDGLKLQQVLAERQISIPIIFISGHGGVPETVQAMKAGAVDFLEKPFRQGALVDCINTAILADREKRAEDYHRNSALQRFAKLTLREREVANFMIANPSSTASKEIGRELKISPRTVDHHRARILEKMEIGSVAELIDLSIPHADRLD